MKSNVIAWAVVSDKKTLCLEYTRQDARLMKRWYKRSGVDAKIVKMVGKEVVR